VQKVVFFYQKWGKKRQKNAVFEAKMGVKTG